MKTTQDAMSLQGRISAHFTDLEEGAAQAPDQNFMAKFAELFKRMHAAISQDLGVSWEEVTKLNWNTTELGPAGEEVCREIEELWSEYYKTR